MKKKWSEPKLTKHLREDVDILCVKPGAVSEMNASSKCPS